MFLAIKYKWDKLINLKLVKTTTKNNNFSFGKRRNVVDFWWSELQYNLNWNISDVAGFLIYKNLSLFNKVFKKRREEYFNK